MSKHTKHKKKQDDGDIFIDVPCVPVKWTTYHLECGDDDEIAIDIGTGKAGVRKCREE